MLKRLAMRFCSQNITRTLPLLLAPAVRDAPTRAKSLFLKSPI